MPHDGLEVFRTSQIGNYPALQLKVLHSLSLRLLNTSRWMPKGGGSPTFYGGPGRLFRRLGPLFALESSSPGLNPEPLAAAEPCPAADCSERELRAAAGCPEREGSSFDPLAPWAWA